MVWRIIVNGVVYVKLKKNVYKAKLMALNCHLPPLSRIIWAIMHVYGAADGGYVICQHV